MPAIFVSILVSLLLHLQVAAQGGSEDVPFDKAYFPNRKAELKDAKSAIKEGDRIYDMGVEAYWNLAIPFYESAHAFNPNNAELNFKLATSYLFSPYKQRSLGYAIRSYELSPQYAPEQIQLILGRGYHLNSRWEEALQAYTAHLSMLKSGRRIDGEAISRVEKYINEVRNGMVLSEKMERVWIDNLGPAVNSSAPEYAPLISTDESLLIVTARREDAVGGLLDESDQLPFEDIYFSRSREGVWSPLQNIGEPINTSGHDASSGLSPDGRTLFVFRGSNKGNGDIYASQFVAGDWTKPKPLGKNINSKAHETSAALSYNGKELYFISDREGGQGGKDIYLSSWDATREDWGPAENLGPTVNTPYDEDGVYLHPDGRTLYFSSKGHNSMGGNDIFYTEKVDGVWQQPVNIGHPINTPDDDVFFVVAADGRTAYYSSIREEGFGDKDIYRITFLGPEKEPVLQVEEQLLLASDDRVPELSLEPEVEIRTSKMILLKGVVVDDKSGAPLEASIDLIDNGTSAVLATFHSDKESGAYLVMLPAGYNYALHTTADRYLFNSMHFDIPDTAQYREYFKAIRMNPIKIGESVVLRNIFFDYNAFSIRKESEAELERLLQLILDNPQIKLEISGHTDNVGGDAYNQELSENRAKAVVDYLVQQGAPRERLIYKGYGKSQAIADNSTEIGRQENRRTEFKIIE